MKRAVSAILAAAVLVSALVLLTGCAESYRLPDGVYRYTGGRESIHALHNSFTVRGNTINSTDTYTIDKNELHVTKPSGEKKIHSYQKVSEYIVVISGVRYTRRG